MFTCISNSIGSQEGSYTCYPQSSDDWIEHIKKKIECPKLKDLKQIKTFMLLNGQLYKKLGNGVLVKCINGDFGKGILEKVHFEVFELEGPTLAQRIQRMGYFLPNLRRQASEIQKNCEQC